MSGWGNLGGEILGGGKNLYDHAERVTGEVVDDGADLTGDALDKAGAHGAARTVRHGRCGTAGTGSPPVSVLMWPSGSWARMPNRGADFGAQCDGRMPTAQRPGITRSRSVQRPVEVVAPRDLHP